MECLLEQEMFIVYKMNKRISNYFIIKSKLAEIFSFFFWHCMCVRVMKRKYMTHTRLSLVFLIHRKKKEKKQTTPTQSSTTNHNSISILQTTITLLMSQAIQWLEFKLKSRSRQKLIAFRSRYILYSILFLQERNINFLRPDVGTW